jgi:flavin-binding protein dodecin
MSLPTRYIKQAVFFVFFASFVLRAPLRAQDVLGGITGTVKDATGAAVPDATVRAQNIGTNLEVVQHTQTNGSYTVQNVPAGAYRVTFTKEGFETETHTRFW